jgi:serine/threonine protein kinase
MLTNEASLQAGHPMGAGPGAAPAKPAVPPDSPLAQYQPLEFLAKGGFGFVVLALDKSTGEKVAIKFVECK